MNFEDPILQQDGTLITRIDVAMLKLATILAALFRDEEDETHTPALKQMFRFGAAFFGCLGISLAAQGAFADAFGTWFLCAALVFVSTRKELACSATGTVLESQSNKLGALLSMLLGPVFCLPLAMLSFSISEGLSPSTIFWLGNGIGLTYVAFLISYVRRLGEPPKKKEKARAHKPVLHS